MSVQYPSHLYIRVDRPLRDDINKAAERAGTTVSVFARQALRSVLDSASKSSPTQREKAA